MPFVSKIMNNTEYYDRLGVSKDASQDEIKRAYRKMSKKYHPDINKEPGAEEKYKEVQEAYETLSDDQKRAAYDQYGPDGANGFGGQGGFGGFDGGAGFGGFEDIFSSFFGGGATRNPNAPRQGDDLQYRVNLSFEEAIFGAEKEVHYNREATCKTCSGSGAKPGTSPVTCGRCHGQGVINVDTQTPLGMMRRQVTCDVCHGTGQEIKEPCQTCHGTGHEKQSHKVSVKIPAGVETGQQIRLAGQGEAGYNGGPYGDLFVVFRVAPSKDGFERDGGTIYSRVAIDYATAVLGGEIEVKTVNGLKKLKIPAGTPTEANFRLRGQGAPFMRGGQGDHIVTIYVDVPKKLNKDQKKALEAFQAAMSGEHKKGFFG